MATTWYLDLINGNNANTGQGGWVNAKKWLNQITPVAGDTVKFAKTPDSEDTSLTPTLTIAKAGTTGTLSASVDLHLILQSFAAGAGAWTAANSATVTTNNTQGSNVPANNGAPSRSAGQVTMPASPALNTKYASIQITTVDLSAYQGIAVYIGILAGSSTAWTDGSIVVCLCSDTAGATVVDQFTVNFNNARIATAPGAWHIITRDGGGNLGSSIQSIAIYSSASVLPPASQFITFSCPTAFKTNPVLLPGDWIRDSNYYVCGKVAFITNGDTATPTLYFDDFTVQSPKALTAASLMRMRPYFVRRVDRNYQNVASNMSLAGTGGTSGSHITFSGGWNTSTDTQDGRTFYDMCGWSSTVGGPIFDTMGNGAVGYIDVSKIWVAWGQNGFADSITSALTGALVESFTDCAALGLSRWLVTAHFRVLTTYTFTNCLWAGGGVAAYSASRQMLHTYTNCIFTCSASVGGAPMEGTIDYSGCSFLGVTLSYTATHWSGTDSLTMTYTNCTIDICTLQFQSNSNFYPTIATFTSSPATNSKLNLVWPCTITGLSMTDTSTTYATGLICPPSTSSVTPDPGIQGMARLINCTFNIWAGSAVLMYAHFQNCTLNMNNTSSQSASNMYFCIAEDTTFHNALVSGQPNLNFLGSYAKVYRCTFDGWNQVTASPGTDPFSGTTFHPSPEPSPYLFVDCLYTNIVATPSHAGGVWNTLVNCLQNHPLSTISNISGVADAIACLRYYNYQRTVGDHLILYAGGFIRTETGTVHTPGGKSWKLSVKVISSFKWEDSFMFPVGRVALKGGLTLTASIWAQCSAGALAFKAKRDQFEFSGAQSELRAVTTTTGAWEQLTVTYTPTIDGVMEFYITPIPTATTNVMYFDDLTFGQA